MIDLKSLFEGSKPFCLIHREERPTVLALTGDLKELERLDQIPVEAAKKGPGALASLTLVPFSQVREKGFRAHVGDEKLVCLIPDDKAEFALEEVKAALPTDELSLEGEPRYEQTEAEYEEAVRRIVQDEIGNGEGANFVLPRVVRGKIAGYSLAKALSIFRGLLNSDYGTYWKFILFTGTRCFVGATPEKHLSIEKGRVVMNPISGTFRKAGAATEPAAFKKQLLKFLADPKEVNELFMVVDEELKMMAQICDQGGIVAGPFMKEMSRLIHTEYHLIGHSTRGLIDNLRESLFAATVTGSPLENACRIIEKYEKGPRRYYAGAIALIGQDDEGEPFLDSPILIRTAEIDAQGEFVFRVGATLVHDSDPKSEVAETKSKGAAVLDSLMGRQSPASKPMVEALSRDPEVLEGLMERNQRLSSFWLQRQDPGLSKHPFAGLKVTLIDHEDDFLFMFGHMLSHLGCQVTRLRWSKYDAAGDHADLTVLGPGPGDPNNDAHEKMAAALRNLKALKAKKRPVFGVCLGHQILCRDLGFEVKRRPHATQGVQRKLDIFGAPELCGFYNTFYGHVPQAGDKRVISSDAQSGEIFGIHDPAQKLIGFQFHPESILTQNGVELVRKGLETLLK